jgi:hypothetical protein
MSMRMLFLGRKRRNAARALSVASAVALFCFAASGPFGPGAGAQTAPPDDPVLLRELVDRLSGDGFGIKSKVVVGSLPTVTPPLALPPGWRVIGGVVRAIPTGPSAASPTVDSSTAFVDATAGTASEALGALTKILVAGGWISQPNGFPGQNGFVVANSPQPAYGQFCAKGSNLSVNAMKDVGSAVVRVSLNANSNAPGFPGPCGGSVGPPVTEVPQIPVVYSQLPRLVLPETAVLISSGGGGGSQFSTASSLTVDKADAAPSLEAFFAPQLLQAGWQKSGAAITDVVAVSTWRKQSGDTPLQATLLIVNAIGSDTRRDLTITVSQEATAGNGFPPPPYPAYPVMVAPPTIGATTTIATPQAKAGSVASKGKKKLKKVSSTKK